MKEHSTSVYTIIRNVECLACGNKGAIKAYGKHYPKGLQGHLKEIDVLQKYQEKPYMSRIGGFGGTVPHECLNCGNRGLIDMAGLEGYRQAFKTISYS